MKKLKLYILSVVVSFLGFVALPTGFIYAAAIDDIKSGVGAADPGGPTVDNAIGTAINILSLIIGVAAIVMMMYGGYKYITSSGDSNKIASAKSTVMYALIGIAIAVLAQVLIRFVIAKATTTVATTF